MARYSIEGSTLQGIANAIREQNGESDTYTPEEMIDAIKDLNVGGGGVDTDAIEIAVDANGEVAVKTEGETIKSVQLDSSFDEDFISENIRQGKNIFGVNGSMEEGVKLNFGIVGGTAEPAAPAENMIWVNTDTPINGYVFSAETPGEHKERVNLLDNLTYIAGFYSNTGTISSQNSTNKELYSKEYIPVTPGETLTWSFAFPSGTSRSMWLSYCTYDANQTFKSRVVPVNNLSAVTTNISLFIPEGISFIRVSFRTFGETPVQNLSVIRTFQDYQPEGLIWICTGTSSPVSFKVVSGTDIVTYPVLVRQFVEGTWQTKTAQTYQNGEWVDWIPWLFKLGDQCVDLTGGWIMSKYGANRGDAISMDGSLSYTGNLGSTAHGLFQTQGLVDVTNYSAINIVIAEWTNTAVGSGGTANYTFGLSNTVQNTDSASSSTVPQGVITSVAKTKSDVGPQTITIDTSSLEGSFYLFIDLYNYYTKYSFVITEIYGVI